VAALTGALCGCVALTATAATPWRVAASGTGQSHALQPGAPSAATATCAKSQTSPTVVVAWAGVAPATSYSVLQSTTSATTGYSVAASGLTSTSWTSGSLTAGATYWFEVVTNVGTNWASTPSAATTGLTISAKPPRCQ